MMFRWKRRATCVEILNVQILQPILSGLELLPKLVVLCKSNLRLISTHINCRQRA